MKYFLTIILFLGLTACSSSNKVGQSQNNMNGCKVLMANIQKTYTGSCRRGLANGHGKAVGSDTYVGDFKKGYPDGDGTYTWANGDVYKGKWSHGMRQGYGVYNYTKNGQKVTQKGYWANNKYAGTNKPKPPFSIDQKVSIDNVNVFQLSSTGNSIKLLFHRNGSDSKKLVSNLMLNGSSGTAYFENKNNFIGFDKVSFPFTGNVKFNIPNDFNTDSWNCELDFTINKPGKWQVVINN